jgi:hypothetical protein
MGNARSDPTHGGNQVIDLRQHYAHRYRVTCEGSCERAHHGSACDPWNAIVLCQHGHIYPHGELLLGAATNNRGQKANSLAALPCVRVVQDGDDGINVVFDASDFAKVAAIMKPRRKRQLTPEQKAERVARLQKYQFSAASQSDFETLLPLPQPIPDSQAV